MQPGDVLLGKFRIERVLGRGGMGFVVAVRHVELDELFAMKLMHAEMLSHGEAVERFVREAKAAARLKSEHVARVHDVGRLETGAPYMLMEHLVGDDLSGLLDKRGALPVREAAQYVLQACEAIAEAHGHGIVHRDLKPGNLFLTGRANGTPCVKVLDFGISKKIDPATKFGPTLTVTGAFMGSPAFMSPEQMLNGKLVDTRSDIWALGAILYELTTGALPFHGETMTELVARVMNEPVTPPSVLRPEISPAFDEVVLTCLQKKTVRRYQSIEELMAALHPFAIDDNPLPVKAASASGLPRVNDDPDSERSKRPEKNRPVKPVPVAAVSQSDDGPDSKAVTHVLKPQRPSASDSGLPSVVDSEFTVNEHTIEMPTQQLPRADISPRMGAVAENSPMGSAARRSSRMLFMGLGVAAAVGIGAIIAISMGESASVDSADNAQRPAISAAPEIAEKAADVKPAPSIQANEAVPVASVAPTSAAAVSTTLRSTSTPKQPSKKIPSLY